MTRDDELEAFTALVTVAALAGKPMVAVDPDSDEGAWTEGAIFNLAWLHLRSTAPDADVPVADTAELATRTVRVVSKVLETWPRLEREPAVQDDSLRSTRIMGLGLADMARDLEGVSGANEILARALEALGAPDDSARARKAGLRWVLWRTKDAAHIDLTTQQPWAVKAILKAAWVAVLAERERERERLERDRLAHGVIGRGALRTLQNTVRVGQNAPELDDLSLVLDRGVIVATVPSALVHGLRKERLDSARRGAELMATTGWNMLLYKGAVSSSIRQRNGEQHPGLHRFAGYAGLAEALGLSSPKHRQALPDMLEFGELFRFDLGDGFEPASLWTHRIEKTGGEGQGRRLEWNINPWMYGADVRGELPKGADKTLVFLSPHPAPMVVGASPNVCAPQWAFWWQFHDALVSVRSELLDTDAMTLDEPWWLGLAEASGWSNKQKQELLPRTIARYTDDLFDQLLVREKGKPWVFKPGRALAGVAEGLKNQELRFRGNSKGGKNKAAARDAAMKAGWQKRGPKRPK